MTRRTFIGRLAASLAAIAGILFGVSFLKQFSLTAPGKSKRVNIGSLPDFPVDTYTYLEAHKIFVYRDHEAIKSVSAVCTHLGCTIQRTEAGFECPCHGSCFSDRGEVISGPAPTSLSWYRLERAPGGNLIVDMNAPVGPGDQLLIS